jgi:gliding motility-associated-like protein
LNNIVGNAADLLNIRPGKYRLKFKDGSACDTIVTSFYVVGINGLITIDTSNMLITPSKCSGNTGSIQQVLVTGGQNFTWTNGSVAMGHAPDIFNLPAGSYILAVSSSFGCFKTSPVIIVPASGFSPINVTAVSRGDAVCNQNNGFAHILSFNRDTVGYTFSWRDSVTSQVMGTGTQLDNLGAGTYLLFATDSNGCEKKIFTAVVDTLPVPIFDYSQVRIKPDNCSLKEGGISFLKVNNLKGPAVYEWYDQYNNLVGSNLNLQNAAAGIYTLKITDAGFCTIRSNAFTITVTASELPAPLCDDMNVPRYSSAAINVRNPGPGNYRLMASATGQPVLQQNTNGNFTVNNITADTAFYIKRIYGACESKTVRVTIKVVDKSFFTIPTAFTPNGDGLNDRLNVRVAGFIALSYFKIYNKWGELVFQTSELNTGWDGIYKGVLQDTCSFVWFAEGRDINSKIITDKGIFTLIR